MALSKEDIQQLKEAFLQTDVMQWALSKMKAEQSYSSLSGGDDPSGESPSPRVKHRKKSSGKTGKVEKYARAAEKAGHEAERLRRREAELVNQLNAVNAVQEDRIRQARGLPSQRPSTGRREKYRKGNAEKARAICEGMVKAGKTPKFAEVLDRVEAGRV